MGVLEHLKPEEQERFVSAHWAAWSDELARTIEALLYDPTYTHNVKVLRHSGTDTAEILSATPADWEVRVNPHFFESVIDQGESAYPVFKAVAYHELSHALWTPLDNSPLLRSLKSMHQSSPYIGQVFNSLEDQRIEILTSAKWRPMRRYFRLLIADFLVANYSHGEPLDPASYLLVTHRHGVPQQLRDDLAAEWDQAYGQTNKVHDLIEEYVQLSLADWSQHTRATEIVKWIADLMQQGRPHPESGQTPVPKGGSAADYRDREGKHPDPQAIAEAAQEAQDEPGSAPGTGSSDSAADAVQQLLDDAHEDLAKETSELADAIRSRASKEQDVRVGRDTANHQRRQVTPEMKSAERQLERYFRRLRRELDDEWQVGPVGKLEGRRYATRRMNPGNLDFFRSFETGGEKEGSVHAVLILDRSSSMHGQRIAQASQAAWVLGRAFATIGARIEVLVYDTGVDPGSGIYLPEHYDHYGVYGSTTANPALTLATESLYSSRANNRIMTILTDGQWFDAHSARQTIEDMNRHGVVTAVAGIAGAVRQHGSHGATTAVDFDSAMGLVPLVQGFVGDALRKAKVRRR